MYENLFASNASLNKAMEFLLASDYNTEKHPGRRAKIRIIQEEDEMEKEKEVMCELQSPDTPIANPWWRFPSLADDLEMTATISANGERTELNMNILNSKNKH